MTKNNNDAIKDMYNHLTALSKDYDFGSDLVWSLNKVLKMLAYNQRKVSSMVPDCIPMEGQVPSKDAVRSYALALFIELGEFVQELDWKPWQNKKEINTAKVAEEFADILAFIGIILVQLEHLGITEEVLAEAYRAKSVVNIMRFLGKDNKIYDQTGELK